MELFGFTIVRTKKYDRLIEKLSTVTANAIELERKNKGLHKYADILKNANERLSKKLSHDDMERDRKGRFLKKKR